MLRQDFRFRCIAQIAIHLRGPCSDFSIAFCGGLSFGYVGSSCAGEAVQVPALGILRGEPYPVLF